MTPATLGCLRYLTIFPYSSPQNPIITRALGLRLDAQNSQNESEIISLDNKTRLKFQ